MCNLCKEKPMTTFDNLAGDVGQACLQGFERRTFVNLIEDGMAE